MLDEDEGLHYEPLHGVLGSRENEGQNNQETGRRVGKSQGVGELI